MQDPRTNPDYMLHYARRVACLVACFPNRKRALTTSSYDSLPPVCSRLEDPGTRQEIPLLRDGVY